MGKKWISHNITVTRVQCRNASELHHPLCSELQDLILGGEQGGRRLALCVVQLLLSLHESDTQGSICVQMVKCFISPNNSLKYKNHDNMTHSAVTDSSWRLVEFNWTSSFLISLSWDKESSFVFLSFSAAPWWRQNGSSSTQPQSHNAITTLDHAVDF